MYIVIHTFATMLWVFGVYFALKAKTFKRQAIATVGVTAFIALTDTIVCAYYEAFVIQNQMKWLGITDVFGWSKFVSVIVLGVVASFVFGLLAAIATWCEEPKQTWPKRKQQPKEFDKCWVLVPVALLVMIATFVNNTSAARYPHELAFREVGFDTNTTVLYSKVDDINHNLRYNNGTSKDVADVHGVYQLIGSTKSNWSFVKDGKTVQMSDYATSVSAISEHQADGTDYDNTIMNDENTVYVTKATLTKPYKVYQHKWFPFITTTSANSDGNMTVYYDYLDMDAYNKYVEQHK